MRTRFDAVGRPLPCRRIIIFVSVHPKNGEREETRGRVGNQSVTQSGWQHPRHRRRRRRLSPRLLCTLVWIFLGPRRPLENDATPKFFFPSTRGDFSSAPGDDLLSPLFRLSFVASRLTATPRRFSFLLLLFVVIVRRRWRRDAWTRVSSRIDDSYRLDGFTPTAATNAEAFVKATPDDEYF